MKKALVPATLFMLCASVPGAHSAAAETASGPCPRLRAESPTFGDVSAARAAPCSIASRADCPPRLPPDEVIAGEQPPPFPLLVNRVYPLFEFQAASRNPQGHPARRPESGPEANASRAGKITHSRPTPSAKRFKKNYPSIYGREPPAFFPS